MNILLATEVILAGGAETFVLRLSNSLQKKGHNVVLFSFYRDNFRKALCDRLAPDVKVIFADIPAEFLRKKTDSLLFRLGMDSSVRRKYIKRSLQKVLKDINADVIHSHLLKVDNLCLEAGSELGIPTVTTIHGDYLQFYNKIRQGIPVPILNYQKKAEDNLSKLSSVVCISDKQLDFFQTTFPKQTAGKLKKIYNGYDTPKPSQPKKELREKLGIADSDFVFGMVSRLIPEKGWDIAIQAVLKLNDSRAHFLAIGDGNYLETLQNKYADHPQIHIVGHTDEPLEWINIFDVGVLPSTYASESLPTVVIEYLRCNKPVVASDAGEIKNMIRKDGIEAGIITPIRDGKVSVDETTGAMKRYMTDNEFYAEHVRNTNVCFEQFDMDKCVASYMHVYEHAVKHKK